jgi:serine/threonine protein kinase
VAANVQGGHAVEESTEVTAETGFGAYTLDVKVGEGPRGTVWRAVQVGTGRQVAVKELAPELTGDEAFMARYRALVARLVALGEHPNRVPVLECIEEPGRVWVVEGWVDGRRLDLLRAASGGRALTPEESVAVVAGVLAGLASAKGIVHGDVRPENIVVAADGTPLVTDFGIPVPPGGQPENGADPYRSAEALRGDRLDARSDVYSAGAVLQDLLAPTPELLSEPEPEAQPGPAPVPAARPGGDTDADPDDLHAEPVEPAEPAEPPPTPTPTPPRPEPAAPRLSQSGRKLARLVQRSVSDDPKKRPARAATFRTSLERLAGECFGDGWHEKASASLAAAAGTPTVPARPDTAGELPPTPLETRLSRRNRRPIPHGTVLGLAVAILLLLAAATITVDRRSQDPAAPAPGPAQPEATPAEIAGSDIAGTWAVVVTVVESSGFFDSSAGNAAVKAYVVNADCSKGPCAYRLTVVGSRGEFALPRVGDDYVLKEQGPNDCIDLATGEVRVPGGGRATVEVKLHPTAARKADGHWVATAFEGAVVTTFDSQNPDCGGGSGVQRTALAGTRQ